MNFYELRTNNVRRVLARAGWTIEDIRQATRDAEMGVAYGVRDGRPAGVPLYRVRSDGRAFAVERTSDRHVILSSVDLDTAREFVREANARTAGQAAGRQEAA